MALTKTISDNINISRYPNCPKLYARTPEAIPYTRFYQNRNQNQNKFTSNW